MIAVSEDKALVILPPTEEYKYTSDGGNRPNRNGGSDRIETLVERKEHQSRQNNDGDEREYNAKVRSADRVAGHHIIRLVALFHFLFRHFKNALGSPRNNLVVFFQSFGLRERAGIKLLLKLNSGLYLFLSRFCISHMLVLCRHLRSSSPAICYRNQYGSHVSCGAAKWGSQPRKKRKENLL